MQPGEWVMWWVRGAQGAATAAIKTTSIPSQFTIFLPGTAGRERVPL
ncbi:hypothetical protein J7I84_00055 [Arthrobacter sp. ISL-85]|nr:hypothetical protein [Arthrobacter sp. ISL-85]MBT2564900.1 hypothetical protein [Arthrobacter sp. ISL-85]